MSEHHKPRPMGFVSPISDTDIKERESKDHNALHHAAHYLKNAVTLESTADEKRRESAIADHAHRNDHGGKLAEAEFWDRHAKSGAHGHPSVHEVDETCEGAKNAPGVDKKTRENVN